MLFWPRLVGALIAIHHNFRNDWIWHMGCPRWEFMLSRSPCALNLTCLFKFYTSSSIRVSPFTDHLVPSFGKYLIPNKYEIACTNDNHSKCHTRICWLHKYNHTHTHTNTHRDTLTQTNKFEMLWIQINKWHFANVTKNKSFLLFINFYMPFLMGVNCNTCNTTTTTTTKSRKSQHKRNRKTLAMATTNRKA